MRREIAPDRRALHRRRPGARLRAHRALRRVRRRRRPLRRAARRRRCCGAGTGRCGSAVMTGASASAEDAARDRANVAAFTRRLARLTGLDMALGRGRGRELPRAVHDQRRAHRLRRPGRGALSRLRAGGDGRAARHAARHLLHRLRLLRPGAAVGLLGGDRPDPRRASAADPALLRARGDGAGDGPAERQPGRAAVAVQRQPRVRAADRARCDPAADALRSAPAARA